MEPCFRVHNSADFSSFAKQALTYKKKKIICRFSFYLLEIYMLVVLAHGYRSNFIMLPIVHLAQGVRRISINCSTILAQASILKLKPTMTLYSLPVLHSLWPLVGQQLIPQGTKSLAGLLSVARAHRRPVGVHLDEYNSTVRPLGGGCWWPPALPCNQTSAGSFQLGRHTWREPCDNTCPAGSPFINLTGNNFEDFFLSLHMGTVTINDTLIPFYSLRTIKVNGCRKIQWNEWKKMLKLIADKKGLCHSSQNNPKMAEFYCICRICWKWLQYALMAVCFSPKSVIVIESNSCWIRTLLSLYCSAETMKTGTLIIAEQFNMSRSWCLLLEQLIVIQYCGTIRTPAMYATTMWSEPFVSE